MYIFKAIYGPIDNNEAKVRILGKKFTINNRDKCYIIYNNKKYELKEYFEDIENNYNHKDLFKLKLIFIHKIIDMSNLFNGCDSLISLSEISKIITKKSTLNISREISFAFIANDKIKLNIDNHKTSKELFKDYKQFVLYSNIISKKDKSIELYITNMTNMFYECHSLIFLSNKFELNTSKVIDMSGMFYGCN